MVLTREADGKHARIHARMPVVFDDRDEARRWLRGEMGIEFAEKCSPASLCIRPEAGEQLEFDFESVYQSE